MNLDRTFAPSVTWLGGGVILTALAIFGLSPESESATGHDSEVVVSPGNSTYPALRGFVSLASSKWDDPFIHMDDEQLESVKTDSQEVKKLIKEKTAAGGNILFLVVPVDEGFDPEHIESRKRRRHAVELAMANQGFGLSYPDRMSYRAVEFSYHFLPRSSQSPAADDAGNDGDDEPNKQKSGSGSKTLKHDSTKTYLPTKLYRHDTSNDLILLTWIQQSHLGQRPLDTIRQVVEPVMDEGVDRKAAFCLLGPSSSDSMHRFVSDAKSISDGPDSRSNAVSTRTFFGRFQRGAMMCNIVCTSTNNSLGLKEGQESIGLGDDVKLKLIHTIGSDDRLLDALRQELMLRGVLPTEESPSEMVLFAEQSSERYIKDLQERLTVNSKSRAPIVIPYLKGIGAKSEASDLQSRQQHWSVQDYLDRSMNEFTTISSSRGINPSRVRSVGIIGSDWKDKNVILKKARHVFPVATFFTTELDARYNLPQVVPHARNLIVASHYGLLINGRSDIFWRVNSIPSFRDGYQTSGFIGASVVCYAFREDRLADHELTLSFGNQPQDLFNLVGRGSTTSTTEPAILSPLTFEIGSHNPVQLGKIATPDYLPLRQPPGVKSMFDTWPWILMATVIGSGALLIMNFLSRYSTDLANLQRICKHTYNASVSFVRSFVTGKNAATEYRTLWPTLITVTLLALVASTMVVTDRFSQSEPILISSGVSLWPPIWGLTAVVILSLRNISSVAPNASCDIDSFVRDVQQPGLAAALKLACTVTLVFYLVSFIESGVIQPPARDWAVRWLAISVLLAATLSLLIVTFKSLLFCLFARKVITNAASALPEKIGSQEQIALVNGMRCTMHLSIHSSQQLVRPAILSILLIVARWRGWDAWGLDRSWYILLATPICISFLAAIVVRIAAIRYRDDVIERLRQEHYALVCEQKTQSTPDATLKARIELLEESEEEVTRLHSGPFGPISQDYLLGAGALVVTIALTGPAGSLVNGLLSFVP